MTPLPLSKDMIFNHTTSEEIYKKVLNLPEFPKGNISSPFSEDKKPSFKLYPNGTFKCNSTGKHGDVFQLVADLKRLDCNTQFNEILNIVAAEMNLSLNNTAIGKIFPKRLKKEVLTEERPFVLTVSNTEMKEQHLAFWDKLGVQNELLKTYKVRAVAKYSFFSAAQNKELTFQIKENKLAFSYEVNGNFEVYIPAQPDKNQPKLFSNGLQKEDIFGLVQLGTEKIENLIICAGKKDTVVAVSRGFKAVTFRSETQIPTATQTNSLLALCENLYICYDNDNGGNMGRNKIIELYPQIIPLTLPTSYNDITDYFQEKTAADFQTIIDGTGKTKNVEFENTELTTIFHIAENYLQENHSFRYNIVSLEIEIKSKKESKWSSCNENSLWLEIQKKSIKIPINSLIAILKSDFVPEYNPLKHYFTNLAEWDKKTDYIKMFSEYVKLHQGEDKGQFEYHFKKWCVRAVKCAIIDDYFNKQAFVLTDDGNGQNIGKSSWCRFLCPPELSNYMAEDMSDDKDARILLCKNFLINLDELAALSRKEINQLKAYFSKAQINERLPYDRKNSIIQRVSSFIGSTNMSTFLQDETGSVRWLCFIVKSIDWNYKKEFDINNLWVQAYSLSKDSTFDETLTLEDIRQNEIRNEKFQITSPERDLIHKYFEVPDNIESAEFLSSTDILHHINLYTSGIRLSNIGIGKALKSIGYPRSKHQQVYGYWVKKKTV
jgi:predicted P-loop ATPase